MKVTHHKYLAHLREFPFVREAHYLERAKRPADALLKLRTPTGTYEFLVEQKRTHLTYALADLLLARHQGKARAKWILFAPYVGRKMAQYLAGKRVNFMDLAGNCYIEVGKEYLAMVEGRTPLPKAAVGRGLGVAGNQVLFAILARPHILNEPVRQVAAVAGVGKTAVANTLLRLEEEGLIGKGKQHRIILNRKEILERWLVGYVNMVRPRLILGNFRTADLDPGQLEAKIEKHLTGQIEWAWGGGAAAFRLDHYYRGEETILHLTKGFEKLPMLLQAIPDRNGFLAVLLPPGPLAFEGIIQRTVHPLLVYTQLMASDDKRAIDAAKRIEQRFLLDE
jgi:hypothetical protein